MIDLKPYHDAVIAADAEVKEIASKINDSFLSETEEGKAKALELKPALDAAQKKYDEALGTYNSMTAANRPSEVAKNFIPVAATTQGAEGEAPKVMNRAAFNALDQINRASFIKGGGKVIDQELE